MFDEDEQCSKPTSVRPDINDTWFVTFQDDDAALNTLAAIAQKTLHNYPIKARIKSENILRAMYVVLLVLVIWQ